MKYVFIFLVLFSTSFVFAEETPSQVTLPDSWGIFECVHFFRTDATKQEDAVIIIQQMISDHLSSAIGITSAILNQGHSGTQVKSLSPDELKAKTTIEIKELKLLYPNVNATYPGTGDDYRLAIQNLVSQKDQLRKDYPSTLFETQFFNVLNYFYDEGAPKASFTVPAVEEWRNKIKQITQNVQNIQKALGQMSYPGK